MSYTRTIPRDLFNEANLLKCYGQLYLKAEHWPEGLIELKHDDEPFDVVMDEGDGDIWIDNIQLYIHGKLRLLRRSLNSREAWPLLICTHLDQEYFRVFDEEGQFSQEMVAFLRGFDGADWPDT
jgi:hypothetical protein